MAKLLAEIVVQNDKFQEQSENLLGLKGSYPRIVTVCVKGRQASFRGSSPIDRRLLLLQTVIREVKRRWERIDAIVFPGGYFKTDFNIGHLPFDARKDALEETLFSRECIQAAKELQDTSPGAFLIAGVDSVCKVPYPPDQLVAAWNQFGIVGLGRKIFPGGGDIGKFLVFTNDFSNPERVVKLPSGHSAMLCVCYDLFGVAETIEKPTKRTSNIRDLHLPTREIKTYGDHKDFSWLRKKCIRAWLALIRNQKISVAIGVIHGFDKTGGDIFWQRHGIAPPSAAINGGLAIASSHFKLLFPEINKSPLAAFKVSTQTLTLPRRNRRKAQYYLPQDGVLLGVKHIKALVRLFNGYR